MADLKKNMLEIEPYFDMELFITTSQEDRIGGEIMERMNKLWEKWTPYAHAMTMEVEGKSYLLAWLDEEVENEIDSLWEESPSESFRNNALAQVMCMSLVHDLLPEVVEAGCAPAPKPSSALGKALKEAGIPYSQNPTQSLKRRYAVLTYYPFKGGCEICDLFKSCPKAQGESMSVTLPGHERGKESE